MKKIILLFTVFYACNAYSQTTPNLSPAQEKAYKDQALQLLKSFHNNLASIGDVTLNAADKKMYAGENLTKFDTDKGTVFNDLDPSGETGKEFSLKIYQNNITFWFPKGAQFLFTNYTVSDIYFNQQENYLAVKIQYERSLKAENVKGVKIDDKKMLDAYIKFPFSIKDNMYGAPKIYKTNQQSDELSSLKKIIASGNATEEKTNSESNIKLVLTPAEEKTFTSSAVLLVEQTLETFKGLGDNNVSFPEDKPMYKSKIMERFENTNAPVAYDLDPSTNESGLSKYLDDFVSLFPDGVKYNYTKPSATNVLRDKKNGYLVVKTQYELELEGVTQNGKKITSKKQMNAYVKYSDKGSQIFKIAYHTDDNAQYEIIQVSESADEKSNSNQKLINDLLSAKKESDARLKQKLQELEDQIEKAKKARIEAEEERRRKEEEARNLEKSKVKDKYSYADDYSSGTIIKLYPTRATEMLGIIGVEQKLFALKEHYFTVEASFGKYFGMPFMLNKMEPMIIDSLGNEASQTSDDDNVEKFKGGYTWRLELKRYYRLNTMNKMYFSFLYYRAKIDYNLTGVFPVKMVDIGGVTGVDGQEISFDITRKIGGGFFTVGWQNSFGKSRIYRDIYVGLGLRKWNVSNNYDNPNTTKVDNEDHGDTNLILIMGIKLGFRILKK